MIYHCKVCHQPIPRELAVQTAAGGFTDGYCQQHGEETSDVSSIALDTLQSNVQGAGASESRAEGRDDAKTTETSETEVSG